MNLSKLVSFFSKFTSFQDFDMVPFCLADKWGWAHGKLGALIIVGTMGVQSYHCASRGRKPHGLG